MYFNLKLSYYFKITFGGNNLYITGVTSLESNVELIIPPIKTNANGEYKSEYSSHFLYFFTSFTTAN